MNRKFIALLAIFAIALSSTGLASLAVIQDNITATITATATTIDFRANGTKSLSVDLGLVERGDVRIIPITLSNSGTGYVSVDQSDALAVVGTGDIGNTTKSVIYPNVSTANCSVAGGVVPTPAQWAAAGLLSATPLYGGNPLNIPANTQYDICVVLQLGGNASLGQFASGGTVLTAAWTLHGYYP